MRFVECPVHKAGESRVSVELGGTEIITGRGWATADRSKHLMMLFSHIDRERNTVGPSMGVVRIKVKLA